MKSPVSISSNPASIDFFESAVTAGFPAPASDHARYRIDLNEHLLLNKDASFLFRVQGDSMVGIGIFDGDTIIVDRSIEPRHNQIVLAVVDQEFTIKRLYKKGRMVRLLPENDRYDPIDFSAGQELSIWGVVTVSLRKLF